jgi:hypothetical protein
VETVIIQPKRQKFEILFMLISIVAIVGVASGLIAISKIQKEESVKLKSYQIDAFLDLEGNDQGIFTDLHAAVRVIEALHIEYGERWPTVSELSVTEKLSPFVEDLVWKERGKHKWTLFNQDQGNVHRAIYVGKSFDENAAGNFLILSEHFHTIDGSYYKGVNKEFPFSIWYSKKWELPNSSNISDGTLIPSGWKEIIARTGYDELKRLGRQ